MKLILRNLKLDEQNNRVFTMVKEVLPTNRNWPVLDDHYVVIGNNKDHSTWAKLIKKIQGIPTEVAFMYEIPPKDESGNRKPFGTLRTSTSPGETKLFLLGKSGKLAYKLNILIGKETKGTLDISEE